PNRPVDGDAGPLAVRDPTLRAGDQVLRGHDELLHQLLRGLVESLQDRVDLVGGALLQRAFRGPQALLRAGDVDVRLPEPFDDPLDGDELRRGGPRLLHRAPLVLLEPGAARLREPAVQVRDRLQGRAGPARLQVFVRAGQGLPDVGGLDALGLRLLERLLRPGQGAVRLSGERDLDAFDDALRGGDELV